jgi:hypothetical protein
MTPKAGGKVDRVHLTQVGRAVAGQKIEPIPSDSPEARGRMERVFGTVQQRLPPLLRLHGIATIEAANRYLREVYIAEHNRRFAVAAAEAGSAFVPFLGALHDILCIRHERVVGNDNCVRCAGRHFVKVTVQVHEYPVATLAIFHGPAPAGRIPSRRHPDRGGRNHAISRLSPRCSRGRAAWSSTSRRRGCQPERVRTMEDLPV